MKVVECDKHHFYDSEKYSTCPHCENGLEKVNPLKYSGNIEIPSVDIMRGENIATLVEETEYITTNESEKTEVIL